MSDTTDSREITPRRLAEIAHQRAETARQEEYDRRQRERKAIEAAKDADTMDWVNGHPFLSEHFPNTSWVLVSRAFPQATACIHPTSDPTFVVVVSKGDNEVAMLPPDAVNKLPSLTRATRCHSLADIGQWLQGQKMVRHAEVDQA